MVLTLRTIDVVTGMNDCSLVAEDDDDSSVVAVDMPISMRCGRIEERMDRV